MVLVAWGGRPLELAEPDHEPVSAPQKKLFKQLCTRLGVEVPMPESRELARGVIARLVWLRDYYEEFLKQSPADIRDVIEMAQKALAKRTEGGVK